MFGRRVFGMSNIVCLFVWESVYLGLLIKKREGLLPRLDLCQFGTSSVTVVRLPSGFWVDLRQMFGHNVCKFGSNFVAEFARIEKGAKGGSCMSQWFDDCIWLYMAGWSCIYVRIGWYWFSFLNELNPIDRIKKHISSFRSKQEQRLTQFCCTGAEDSIPRAPPLRNLSSFVGFSQPKVALLVRCWVGVFCLWGCTLLCGNGKHVGAYHRSKEKGLEPGLVPNPHLGCQQWSSGSFPRGSFWGVQNVANPSGDMLSVASVWGKALSQSRGL